MRAKSIFKKIHLWLGVVAGVIIAMMCITGAILVFQDEILQLTHPKRYKVSEVLESPLPLDELVERVNAQLTDDQVTAMQLTDNPKATAVATLASGARSHAYVDPYTAEIKGYYNYRSGFFFQVMRLHRWFMFKDIDNGRVITGGATIIFVVALISGIVVWAPRRGAALRNYFTIKRGVKSRRRVFDLHRILGFYAGIVLLVLSLTGLMWSFDWYRSGVGSLFGIEQGEQRSRSKGGRGSGEKEYTPTESDWWQSALTTARKELPETKYIRVAKSGDISVLSKRAPHPRATDSYSYDYNSGVIAPKTIYGEERNSYFMMTWAYALHVGNWGGVGSKLLVFVAAVIGASLPITGYVMWIRRLRAKNRRNNI